MTTPILLYGADWCSDCRRAKNVLVAHGATYTYLEVDKDEAALARAVEISGAKSIPVIVWPDGSYLVEPESARLAAAIAAGSAR